MKRLKVGQRVVCATGGRGTVVAVSKSRTTGTVFLDSKNRICKGSLIVCGDEMFHDNRIVWTFASVCEEEVKK